MCAGDGGVCGALRAAAAVPAAGRRRARRQHALRHRRAGHRQRTLRTRMLHWFTPSTVISYLFGDSR